MRSRTIRCFSIVRKHAPPSVRSLTRFADSGHGGQQADRDGDEIDGLDETIFPSDWKTAGVITDDVCGCSNWRAIG